MDQPPDQQGKTKRCEPPETRVCGIESNDRNHPRGNDEQGPLKPEAGKFSCVVQSEGGMEKCEE